MELLIGCGNDRDKRVTNKDMAETWFQLVTLDMNPDCHPDIVHNLDDLPLPFEDDMFHEVHAYDVIEHLGRAGDYKAFFAFFEEIWRILKPEGYFCATVPCWDSEHAWSDPGHTRVITPTTLTYLSQKEYQAQVGKTKMTDYRDIWECDFDIVGLSEEGDIMGFILQAVKE